jgi:hypothetical protein
LGKGVPRIRTLEFFWPVEWTFVGSFFIVLRPEIDSTRESTTVPELNLNRTLLFSKPFGPAKSADTGLRIRGIAGQRGEFGIAAVQQVANETASGPMPWSSVTCSNRTPGPDGRPLNAMKLQSLRSGPSRLLSGILTAPRRRS